MVVGVDVGGDPGAGLGEAFPFGSLGAAFLELPEPGLDEGLGLGVAVAAPPVGHAPGREVAAKSREVN